MKTSHLSTIALTNDNEWGMRSRRMWEQLNRASSPWARWPSPCQRTTSANIRLPPDTLNHPQASRPRTPSHPCSCPLGSAWVESQGSLFREVKTTEWLTALFKSLASATHFCVELHDDQLDGGDSCCLECPRAWISSVHHASINIDVEYLKILHF